MNYFITFGMKWWEIAFLKNHVLVLYAERRFSFLSEDEVNNLRQEEGKIPLFILCWMTLFSIEYLCWIERKIANLTNEQLMNLSRLDDVEEADEEEEEDSPKLTGVVPITVLLSLYHWYLILLLYIKTKIKKNKDKAH